MARYNITGTLDTSFDTDGIVTTDIAGGTTDSGNAVAIQTDGKIVVAGTSLIGGDNDFVVVRYNPNGSLDTSFNTDWNRDHRLRRRRQRPRQRRRHPDDGRQDRRGRHE